MRRSSLTQEQAAELGAILRTRRHELGLSVRDVSAESTATLSSISTLEAGTNLTPQPEILKGIARTLGLSMTDLMVVADWLPAGELPSLGPYLRAKYGLDDSDAADVDEYLARLQARHGARDRDSRNGPRRREDEQ